MIQLNYNKAGLSDKDVLLSREKHGSNRIISSKKNSFIKLVIESLNDPIIKILLIALGVKVVFLFQDSDFYELIGIILSILVASIISSLSEYGSEKAFQKLAEENSKINVKVFRNKKLINVDIDDIVVNDVVLLESGDRVCADGVLVSGEVYADESMLSGEPKEKYKKSGDNVFRGSIITNKHGIMKVNAVGINTFYGNIAKSIEEDSPISPLKLRLRKLAQTISKIGYFCAFLVMLSYLFNVIVVENNFEFNSIINMLIDYKSLVPHLLYSLTLAVTIIVVCVPEGLPMMITLVLSSNMKRMLKNNVLVRKLVGIETAGNINILFSDKTGTITKGEFSVVGLYLYDNTFFKSFDSIKSDKLKELMYLSLIYNNAAYFNDKEIIGGNVTDRAIMKFVGSNDRTKYEILSEESFDSKIKYSSVTLNYEKSTTFYKGAYEKLSNKISFCYDKTGAKRLIKKQELDSLVDKYSKDGYRIITLTTCSGSSHTFLGFVLIKDEVRKESIEGIKMVKEAGIQTVMLTGDSLETAKNIAYEIGLISDNNDIVITSDELNEMSDEKVKEVLPNLKVVARSLPHDKKRLVLLSQELGLVVGMTGDGVNDAPALKKADVGFAMGSGTEVAKEVSDIVIIDDNFLSIAKTILFGRTIFKSIRKFIIFQLTVNLCAVSLSVIGPLVGIVTPVTVIQMLWINMVMDTLAGIAFAYEAPLRDYMKEKPKKKDEPIMNSYMINEIFSTGIFSTLICFFFLKSKYIHQLFRIDNNDKYVMTAFFGLFIFLAIFNSFNARTHRLNLFANIFRNKAFLLIISLIVVVQLFLIYCGGSIFRTTGLTLLEFQIMIFLAFLIIPFDLLRKIVLKKINKLDGC